MADVAQLLRRFAPLERRRREGGLSGEELRQWGELKSQLDEHFRAAMGLENRERRASLRVPTRLQVTFESLGKLQRRLMTNLSRGGMYVATDHPLEIGSPVHLRLRIAESGEELEIEGVVISNHVADRFELREPGMGVRFVEMKPEVRARLDAIYEGTLKQVGRLLKG